MNNPHRGPMGITRTIYAMLEDLDTIVASLRETNKLLSELLALMRPSEREEKKP